MKNNIRRKLIIPSIYVVAFLIISLCVIVVGKGLNYYSKNQEKTDYVNKEVVKDNTPNVKEESKKIIKPYTDESVSIGKYYYDYKSDEKSQEKSIVYYEGTYMQNSGVDYISDKTFDVVSVLDGEVLSIKEDKNLGNIVEVKHDKDLITVYQGLDKVNVKKGETINQSDVIGTSGSSKVNKDYKNYVHFEVYHKGELIDPEKFYSYKLEDL